MNRRVAFYTCIFGGFDRLKEPVYKSILDEADLFIVTDNENIKSSTYQIIKQQIIYGSPRMAARYVKTHPEEYITGYDWVFFHDGSFQLNLESVEPLIEEVKNYDLMAFKHHKRNCIYQEARECARYMIDDISKIKAQIKEYKKEGYPKGNGLFETGFLYRNLKNNKITKLNKEWWDEILRFSNRDQISLPFLIDKLEVNAGFFKGNKRQNSYVKLSSHSKKQEPVTKNQAQKLKFKVNFFLYKYYFRNLDKVRDKLKLIFNHGK